MTSHRSGADQTVGPAIVAEELVREFGTVRAVDGVTFAVERGEFFALLGPNGAGKTTTLHMLTTLIPPTSGRAEVMGLRRRETGEAQCSSTLGWSSRTRRSTSASPRPRTSRSTPCSTACPGLSAARASNSALSWAQLSQVGRRRVRTFSGGMKRRLELARALMHGPSVLFLDEPTLGLDPQGRRNLWERISELREQGMTVLMTTHNLPEAEACDRVGIIDHGKLVAIGTPEALIAEHAGTRAPTSRTSSSPSRVINSGTKSPRRAT
jgi:ABC-2 type transport system ATP-binding protein